MALPEYDYLKHLNVSRKHNHSDDSSPEHSVFFFPPVGCADVTSVLYLTFSALYFSFCNFNQPVHTIVVRCMIIFLKTQKLLFVCINGPLLVCILNISITFTHCCTLLCKQLCALHIFTLHRRISTSSATYAAV